MVNDKLFRVLTDEMLIEMGFTHEQDVTGDYRGATWDIKNKNFYLSLDAWGDVTLFRRNPDTDSIKVHCETVFDLQCIVDWIK